ncbi:MAG: hypothetical protein K0R63_288 [Rickettsiales bacterium]|jgi:hypothetical protein|nr:hypothetical protein [Rickettsiales bacterium]
MSSNTANKEIENNPIVTLCALCDVALTNHNNSEEHIIPNSIGGWEKIGGFICQTCNSQCGETWDKELARQLNPLSLLLGIKRDRGNSPAQEFATISGKRVRLHHDGSINLPKPIVEREQKGSLVELKIQARSVAELKQIVSGIKRKHPDLDVNAVLENAKENTSYLDDPLHIGFSFGGSDVGRSVVKSALALAVKNGIDPKSCKNAINYLRNIKGETCFGYYYEHDVILNRPKDKVLHCVAISGDVQAGVLLGYVEFFSAQRMVVCLSDEYSGDEICDIYAIDPVTGKEMSLEFNIPLTRSDIELVYDYKKIPPGSMEQALDILMGVAIKNDFQKASNIAIDDAISYAFEQMQLRQEEQILTSDNVQEFTEYVFTRLQPFLRRHTH